MDEIAIRNWRIGGQVQGVGFRPFVWHLAMQHGVDGWVRNCGGWVEIVAAARPAVLDAFLAGLFAAPPPLARPVLLQQDEADVRPPAGFAILSSREGAPDGHLPPDLFVCPDCLAELRDPANRRYRYPFINCTQCGPRYTLIHDLPYDRVRTSMAGFALCEACQREYADPADRRFHAEPLACPQCGPQLRWSAAGAQDTGEAALAAAIDMLRAGEVVAMKGVGGYHLLCDAASAAAIALLRQRKRRPHKPLAIMCRDLAAVEQIAVLEPQARSQLQSPQRPIVLLAVRAGCLPAELAPGLGRLGIMLPYSPLHTLLLDDFGGPLVVTSGNLSGEPVLLDAEATESRLAQVAAGFLHHDRPIVRAAEDTVVHVVSGQARMLRPGRGTAPLQLQLPGALARPTLALGGQEKVTLALGWGSRVVVSPHLGNLAGPAGWRNFLRVAEDLQQLYGVQAKRLALDYHPAYTSRQWARQSGLPLLPVWHHHAHASALALEYPDVASWLVFAWDGLGLGVDGQLWGGETFYGGPGAWQHCASFRPIRLPGAEQVIRQPWRTASSVCWHLGQDGTDGAPELVWQQWQKGVNAPFSSAAGRLFDAAAVLLGLCHEVSYEAQAPLLLETAAAGYLGQSVEMPWQHGADGVWRIDWSELFWHMQDARYSVGQRAADFHVSLAFCAVRQVRHFAAIHKVDAVGLSGGVMQNRLLVETIVSALQQEIRVCLPVQLPCNDGGLSAGQLFEVMVHDNA